MPDGSSTSLITPVGSSISPLLGGLFWRGRFSDPPAFELCLD